MKSNSGWAERSPTSGRSRRAAKQAHGAVRDGHRLHFRPVGPQQVKAAVLVATITVDYDGVWQWRMVEDLTLDKAGPFTLQLGALWQELENGAAAGNRLSWYSLGLRPAYYFNRHFSLELEAGLDHSKQKGGLSGSLVKVTLAPQITPKVAALSRPSLRAYVTWASWSDAFVGLVAPVRYGDQNHGFSAGIQLETWW